MFGRNSDAENSSGTSGGSSSSESRRGQTGHEGVLNQSHDVSAFVGEGVEFKGVINYQGTVRIDGQLEGEIHTEGVLIVGQGAVIDAKVEAGTIICQGRIVGDILARDKIQLMSPAVLNGSLKTPSLSMEEGVLFNGTCEMGPVGKKSSSYSSDSLKAV
ncbi:polymer-forming cytoskeletal protein [Candidatus Nitronereus thalassa]|uniref:Polymer-forming cytoskeletal protein n=1 Tax=Candidatus Nitronereus thalassa TaxID=3020898 RepID=A0ABU3K949_9BACT|nr:polymer-forming cytoskeletal protein [Candidatus Nitronereus thalassa]MDT7042906.1 polymer-forming cytoskeletal protein [Candidatus Nitronereus thalassa]